MPSVSIITPCFNAAAFLSGTMHSVLRQDFADWEHILVDDGSTDDSLAIARGVADRDPRFRVFSQPNGGMAFSRNAGFSRAAAESRYLMFLDADDILEPHALSTLLGYLEQHPQVGLVYGTFSVIDSAGDTIFPAEASEWWPNRYVPAGFRLRELDRLAPDAPLATLVSCNRALQGATLLRRSVFARTRGWDETLLEGAEDDDMVLQMALIARVHFVPVPVMRYRRHASNTLKHTVYRGIKQFHRKWWYQPGLGRRRHARVRRAIRFDYRLAGLLQLDAAVRRCGQGAWSEAAGHARSAFKKLSAYALLSAGIAGPVLGSGGHKQAGSRDKQQFPAC